MKVTLNPMPILLAKAEAAIDAHFNGLSASNAQKDQEYTLKRTTARLVLVDGVTAAPEEFAAEAQLMGLSVVELATMISMKPDLVLERGLQRRTAILSVRSAGTPADIDAVLARYGARPQGA